MGKYLGAGMGLLSLLIVVAIVLYMNAKQAEVLTQPNGPIDQAEQVRDMMNQRNANLGNDVANQAAQTPPANGQPTAAATPAAAPAAAASDATRPATPAGKVKQAVPNQIHSPAEDMLKEMQ